MPDCFPDSHLYLFILNYIYDSLEVKSNPYPTNKNDPRTLKNKKPSTVWSAGNGDPMH